MRRSLLAFVALAAFAAAAEPPKDPILASMQDEMRRSLALKVMSLAPPYYFEYTLHDMDNLSISATLGALVQSRHVRFRMPEVQVRAGDYQFDNTNFVGSDYYSGARYDVGEFPLDNSYDVLRHHWWLMTDMAFKRALEGFSMKRAALRNVTQTETLPDFYHAASVEKLSDARIQPMPEGLWTERVRRVSAVFNAYPRVARSLVTLDAGTGIQYLATSEGTRIRIPEGSTALRVRAVAQAADGMPVRDAAVFYALDAAGLPADVILENGAKEVAKNVTALADAPLGEAYTGPVLFEGTAAAQLFAEVLGRNLVVPRRPVPVPGHPAPVLASELENRIGSRILPEWINVTDDPAAVEWQGHKLFGHYEVDLEGTAAEKVDVVEKGVLKRFLLTRQPVKGFDKSNGHARLPGSFGAKSAGIGNLFVQTSSAVPAAELRKRLLAKCQERNQPFGLVVRKMDYPSSASADELRRLLGGMMQSGSSARPVSVPLLVYRVYPDGREELVRGLRFRGLNTRSLKDIAAASQESFIFNFYESTAPFAMMGGANFVSEATVVAPSVLIDDLELEPARDELPKPPLAPPPPLAALDTRVGTGLPLAASNALTALALHSNFRHPASFEFVP